MKSTSNIEITPIRVLDDNYVWLLRRGGEAVCVDPGEAEPVAVYLHRHGLNLVQIWITHHHGDHTGGIAGLKRTFPDCTVFGNRDIVSADCTVSGGSRFDSLGASVQVWATPGHTDSHLSFLLHEPQMPPRLFCGDTLFSAGCGRVFPPALPQQLFDSLNAIKRLPEHTLLFPAHEYTAANLRFAAHIEPENADIQAASAALRVPSLPVSLQHECRINPFLRTHLAQVQARTAQLCGGSLADECAVFTAMRELKNVFK